MPARANKQNIMRTSRLITSGLAEAFEKYPLYSQDDKRKDAVCVCIYGVPFTNIRYYITEASEEGDDITLFGITTGLGETEYGYISLNELEGISVDASIYGLGELSVELFNSRPIYLGDIMADDRLREFLNRLYGEDEA